MEVYQIWSIPCAEAALEVAVQDEEAVLEYLHGQSKEAKNK
jgi:hypothetical protein